MLLSNHEPHVPSEATSERRCLQTVEWAKAQDYNWSGLSQQTSLTAKAKRSLLQFTPYSWDDFQWKAFSTPKRCVQSLGLLTVFLLMEVRPLLVMPGCCTFGHCPFTVPNTFSFCGVTFDNRVQVNAFFLKYILWIPPTNPLNTLRLLILFLAALPTAKVWPGDCPV
jgi:phosphatidylserine synthase 2